MAGWDGSVGTWLLGGRAATRADGIRTGRFWRARAATKAARTCQNSPPVDLVRPSLREGSLTNPASASPGVKSQVKDNHEKLHERVRLAFRDADRAAGTTLPLADVQPHTTLEKGHGRIERRRCLAIGDPTYLAYIDPDHAWPNLTSVIAIESTRRIGDDVSTGIRHYLSSLPADAARLHQVVRSHWGIENRLHWVLDLAFDE